MRVLHRKNCVALRDFLKEFGLQLGGGDEPQREGLRQER